MRRSLFLFLILYFFRNEAHAQFFNQTPEVKPAKWAIYADLGGMANLTLAAGIQYRWQERKAVGLRPGWYTDQLGTEENPAEYMRLDGLRLGIYYRYLYREETGTFIDVEFQPLITRAKTYTYEYIERWEDGVQKLFYTPVPRSNWFLQPSIAVRLGQENTRKNGFWSAVGIGLSYRFGNLLEDPVSDHRDWDSYFKPAYSGLALDLTLALGARIR